MKVGLAAEAAGKTTETVDVGPSGVVRRPAGLWVEGVLLIYVVVLLLPVSRWWWEHISQRGSRERAWVKNHAGARWGHIVTA